jgi:hypothetical protein
VLSMETCVPLASFMTFLKLHLPFSLDQFSPCMHSFIHSFIYSSIHSLFIHPFIHSFIHPSIHSSIHSSLQTLNIPYLEDFHYALNTTFMMDPPPPPKEPSGSFTFIQTDTQCFIWHLMISSPLKTSQLLASSWRESIGNAKKKNTRGVCYTLSVTLPFNMKKYLS